MGFLNSIWPFSALAIERENVEDLEKELAGSREAKQDLARFMGYFDKQNDECRRVNADVRGLRLSVTTFRSREAASDKRIAELVAETDRLTRLTEAFDKENNRLAQSVVALSKEAEDLKAKLSRKGTRRKKSEVTV